MAAQNPPVVNVAYVTYLSLVSQANTKIFQANPTLAAGDVKVAIDDGAPANLATLPVVDADFTKRVKVNLSAAEMNGDNISVLFSDAAGAEWCDLSLNIQTVAGVWNVGKTGYSLTQAFPANFSSLSISAAGLVDILQTAADKVWLSATRTLSAFSTALALSVWDVLETAIATASSIGLKVKTNLDAAVSSRMATYAQPAGFLGTTFPAGTVANTTNITAGTITTVTNLTNAPTAGDLTATMKTSVQTAAEAGMVTHRLDELLNADSDIDGVTPPAVGSVFHELMTKTAGSFTFDQATDSMEAIRDRGDTSWTTAVGFATPTNITAATGVVLSGVTHTGAVIPTVTNLTTNNDKTGYGLSAAAVQAVWDALTSALTTAGSIGKHIVDNLVAGAIAAIKAQTDKFVFTVANQVDANVLSLSAALRPGIRKNVALPNFLFVMTDSTTHNPAVGKTVTVTRKIDAGAHAAGTLSAVTEVANGQYSVDWGAGDLNGDVVTLRATAAGCDDLFVTIRTSP